MHPRASFPALLALLSALLLAPAAAHAAADRVYTLERGSVRSERLPGSELAELEGRAAARPVASAARARAPKKQAKPKQPAYSLSTIRKKINGTRAPAQARYDARAALTSLYDVTRRSPKRSQARREGEGLLKVVTQLARGNRITRARLPILTETLKRNAQWWKQRKATGSGARVTFAGSELVWQLYPGSGLQLQWLGTFGAGNGIYFSGSKHRPRLATLVDEALALAVPRAGGIAWEYMFPFGGGSPPWASGMAQATGIQVLARAAGALGRPELLQSAKQALPLLKTDPPQGVSAPDATGTHFLIYSYDDSLKVLNAHNQTVNGLYAYVLAAPDDTDARLLLLDGLEWLNANLPRYVVGNWSRYALGGAKATTHYHGVARDFLKTLCSLLKADAAMPAGGPTGAYPSDRVCDYAAKFDGWAKKAAKAKR